MSRLLYSILFILFLSCVTGWFVMYFLGLPFEPQPDTGHVYAAPIHGDYVYFTKAQHQLHLALPLLALCFGALYVLVRLRLSGNGRRLFRERNGIN